MEKHAVNVNVDMFGNILDNPKKNYWDTNLSRSQIYNTNIPWWNNTPWNAFPARSRRPEKSSRHVLPDKSGGTWSSTSSPSSQSQRSGIQHLLMLQFFWPALRLVVSPTIYKGFSSSKGWCRNSSHVSQMSPFFMTLVTLREGKKNTDHGEVDNKKSRSMSLMLYDVQYRKAV